MSLTSSATVLLEPRRGQCNSQVFFETVTFELGIHTNDVMPYCNSFVGIWNGANVVSIICFTWNGRKVKKCAVSA
jgi:hypothetical protein